MFSSTKSKAQILQSIIYCRPGNSIYLRDVPIEFKNDRDIVCAIIAKSGISLEWADDEIRSDKTIVLTAVKNYGRSLTYASEDLRGDIDVVLCAMKQSWTALSYASNSFKNNIEYMKMAMAINGEAIRYALPTVDKSVVIEAIRQNSSIYIHIPEHFKEDEDVLFAGLKSSAICNAWDLISNISEKKLNDRSFIERAVKINGNILRKATRFNNDRKITTDAMIQDAGSYMYVSDYIKSLEEFALIAFKYDGRYLHYAPENIKSNKKLVITAVSNYGLALQYAPDVFKSDREVVLAAVYRSGCAIRYAHKTFKSDIEIVLIAIGNSPDAIQFVATELQKDRRCILVAIKNDSKFYKKLDVESTNDPEYILTELTHHGKNLHLINSDLLTDKLKLIAISNYGNAIQFKNVGREIRSNRLYALIAVRQNGYIIRHLRYIKKDMTIMIAAAAQNIDSIKYFSKKFRNGLFADNVKNMIATVYNFKLLLLATRFSNNSLLTKLENHGKYAAIMFKKQIASSIGIQTGQELFELFKVYMSFKL
jgi:hypothetical protein